MRNVPISGKLLVCFATVYLVWGSTYMVASIGVHALPPLLFGGIRFTCAGILLGLTTLALGNRFNLDATEWRHMFIVAVGNVFIANGATNIAMQHVASNQTAILNASAALWIALLATRGRRAHAIDRRTLIGLVGMLKNLSDPKAIGPNMAVALLTTMYGTILANFLGGPIGNKLAIRNAEERLNKEIIIQGVLGILTGANIPVEIGAS